MFMFSHWLQKNTRLIVCSLSFVVIFSVDLSAQTAGDYRSRQSGPWNDVNSWQRYSGTAWLNAVATPTSTDGLIEIVAGHTISISASVTIDQTTISTGATLELTGGTITLNDGIGTDLQINGTYIRATSTSITVGSSQIVVANGGIYEHKNLTATPGGSIPLATWQDGSLLKLSSGSNAGGLNQSFYDVLVLNGTTTLSPDATSRTMTVRNDMRIEGGAFQMKDGGLYGGVHLLIINGNFLHTGGTYTFNANNESTSEIRLELKKDWIISGTAAWGGFVASSGAAQCNSGVYFSGTIEQTFSTVLALDGGDLRNRFYVKTPHAGLHEKYVGSTAQYTINGSGGVCPVTTIAGFSSWPTSGTLLQTFTINNPAGVILRDNRNIKDTLYRTNGSITADPTDPTVEVISYSTGATLEYNGTAAITTEDMEFPTTNGPTNLNINNPGSVTLHASRSIAGKLIFSIDNGLLNTTACKNNETTTGTAIITLNDDATVVGAGDKRFVNGVITKIGNDAFEFPIGEKDGSVLKYGPARITAPSNVTDQYTACYVGSNPGSADPTPGYDPTSRDNTLDNPPVDYKVSTCEYWHVNSSSASTNVLLSLSWAYGRSCKFSTAAELVIANWLSASSQWTNRLNNCGTCPDPDPSTQRSGWVQSPITLSETSPNIQTFTLAHPTLATATLNESAITLRAIRRNHADQLYWTLTRACINATVSIERSTDAFSFNNILQFPVRDLESCQTNMQYAHHGNQPAAASFYRLKAILTNGQTFYSNTVRLDSRLTSLQISPNPSAGQIRLTWANQRMKELTICNQLGQVIYSDKNIQTNPYSLSLASWRSGIYYLRMVYDNGETENHKIIRQ
jgi:hypothetical protein